MNDGARLASEIAAKAKSNLALALGVLPIGVRRDMRVLYAFCRLVDDIAEDESLSVDERRRELAQWRARITQGDPKGDDLCRELLALPIRHDFPRGWLVEIIDGVATDLEPRLFEDWDQLLAYCRPVASVVGLCSSRIFGCRSAQSEVYATELGYALQLTNILRDVGEDARTLGRVYLPVSLLASHGLGPADVLSGVDDRRMRAVLLVLHRRALLHYQRAHSLMPMAEQRYLVASRMMTAVYRALLNRIAMEGYPVQRYRVSLPMTQKLGLLASYHAAARLPWVADWLAE